MTLDNYFINIYKMMLLNIAFENMLAEGNFQAFYLNYKKSRCRFLLELLQQCLLIQGRRPGDLLHRHLKDVKNNNNILLALIFLFTSISSHFHNKNYFFRIFSFTSSVECYIFTMCPFFIIFQSFY